MPVATKPPPPAKPVKRHPMARLKYGGWFKPLCDPKTGKAICPIPEWQIEAKAYLKGSKETLPGFLGKAEHFRRMITCIFASPVAKRPFQWNPNAVRIVDKYFEHDYVAIAGHASSSKTECCAIIAIGEFLADPENTACLITSTTLSESRGRVWGRCEFYWQECLDYFTALGAQYGLPSSPPGELVSSSGIIRYKNPINGKKDDTRGIKLVPGKESEVKEGIGRMKGFKAKRLRLFADELSDLSHKLLEAAETNLFVNEDFKMVGCFNPNSHFDPAGVFSEPRDGWASVDVLSSDGWPTKRGYCIRFDGQASPNVVAGCKIWEGLLTLEKLEQAKTNLGDNSPGFVSMYRGSWSSTGHKDGIYSEAEVIKYMGMLKVDVWENAKVRVGGFDPSFAHGGDRAVLVLGDVGRASCFGVFKPCVESGKIIFLDENLDTKLDKKEQVIQRLKEACMREGLDPENLGMDATGGGDVFATLMARDPFFGNKFKRLQFGGEASELIFQGRRGKDKFVNLMSEIWYAGKPLLRSGQIKGLNAAIVREMTLRLYEETGGSKKRVKVEPKEDFKKRLNGNSPDVSDAFFIMLHMCRLKHGLRSDEIVAKPKMTLEKPSGPPNPFAWGLKKKPRINEPEYTPSGGGWADNDNGAGGMFSGM